MYLYLFLYLSLIRFLSTGDAYKTIARNYRMGRSTVSKCINKVFKAIIHVGNTQNGTFQPIPRAQQRRTEAQELRSALANRETVRQYLADHPNY